MQRIHFNEVVTRDGFQNEARFVPTDDKVALVDELSGCGFAKIEVTSFTSAKAIPMLRDAEEVMGRIRRAPGVEYTVLVPNVRGAERALECQADEFNLVMSTSETHNLANLRMPREKSFAGLRDVIALARGRVPVNVSLSTAFGCPMEGVVPDDELLRWAGRFAELGVRGLTICDTTGMADPAQVARVCRALQDRFGTLQLTLHFHNTRGMGLANLLAAVQQGIHRFDGSLGGLGGCPYAPGASGNICTEDAVHMLQAMGHDTGIQLGRLLAAARRLPDLVGHEVPGQVAKAGRSLDLHPCPAPRPGTSGATRMIASLDHLVLTTARPDACIDFYTRVLGMSLETFVGGTPPVERRAFRFGTQKINLHVQGAEFEPKAHLPVPGALDLCFLCTIPLDDVLRRLEAEAWPIVEGPVQRTGATGKIRSVYVRDPDLNLIELSELAR